MPKIKMVCTTPASEDGISIKKYLAGEVYDVSLKLAETLLGAKFASEYVEPPPPEAATSLPNIFNYPMPEPLKAPINSMSLPIKQQVMPKPKIRPNFLSKEKKKFNEQKRPIKDLVLEVQEKYDGITLSKLGAVSGATSDELSFVAKARGLGRITHNKKITFEQAEFILKEYEAANGG